MQKSLVNSEIFEIDVIRCVAIVQVVLFHMCVAEAPFANALILWGREGVGLFFAISGAGLINRYYDQFDCKSYFKKRIISLYIPFWFAYAFLFLRNYVVNGFLFPWEYMEVNKKYMLLSVLGVDGFASAMGIPNFYLVGEWFLAVILFVYLVFPLYRKLFIRFPELTVILFLIFRVALCLKNPFPLVVCFNPITAMSNFSIGAYLIYSFSKSQFKRRNLVSVKNDNLTFLYLFWKISDTEKGSGGYRRNLCNIRRFVYLANSFSTYQATCGKGGEIHLQFFL